MRPVLLELEGFGAFRDRTTVDFGDAELFALVGPTGSGKSTIIDAICFVLYGNVPRYDDHRLVGAAMTMGAAEMRVRLRFEVAGEVYVAVRVVRRAGNGKVATKEARLERLPPAGSADDDPALAGEAVTTTLAGRESEMREAIDDLLGLSFEDFTRCVVLPQGDFARFLHDKPADRQALLVRLLDLGLYQRLQSRASVTATELDHQIRFVDGQLAELGVSTFDGAAARQEAERLAAASGALVAATADFERLDVTIESGLAEQRRLGGLLTGLASIAIPPDVAERAARGAMLADALAAAEAAAESATIHVAATDADVEQAGPVARWEEILRLHDRRIRGIDVVDERSTRVEEAQRALVAAEQGASAAEAAVAECRQRSAAIERANLAHVLAVDLAPGEPCPVCEQIVDHLPLPVSPPGLDEASADLRAAEATARRSAAELNEARVAAGSSAASLEQAVALLGELTEQLCDAPDRESTDHRLTAARTATSAAEAARRVERDARDTLRKAREADVSFRRSADSLLGDFHAQRDAVSGLEPPPPGNDLALSWAELAAWAVGRRAEVEAAIVTSVDAVGAARAEASARLDAIFRAAFGPDRVAPGDRASLASAIDRAGDRLQQAIAADEQRRQRTAQLEAQRVTLGDRRMVAGELAKLLKADRFQRWLIASTLAELAERASERLRAMSAGQFSLDLSDNGEFAVIDHGAANERRPVRTLSGGETFQASLALALALAEGLGELSGKARRAMDAIFLDEGFGSLDSESLDLVASTIEALSTVDGGRMVGVVTHVPSLAERLPVRFRVSRDARTASVTREVQE